MTTIWTRRSQILSKHYPRILQPQRPTKKAGRKEQKGNGKINDPVHATISKGILFI